MRYDSVSRRPGLEPTPQPAPRAEPVLEALAPLELAAPAALVLRGRRFDAGSPAVMAIVNRTRDSFFSGNRHGDLEAAKARARRRRRVRRRHRRRRRSASRAGGRGRRCGRGDPPRRAAPPVGPGHAPGRHPQPRHLAVRGRPRGAPVSSTSSTTRGRATTASSCTSRPSVGAGYVVSHTGGLPPRTDPVDVSYGDGPLDVVRDVWRRCRAVPTWPSRPAYPRSGCSSTPPSTSARRRRTRSRCCVTRPTSSRSNYPVLQAMSRKDFIGETPRPPGRGAARGLARGDGGRGVAGGDGLPRRTTCGRPAGCVDMVATIRGDRAADTPCGGRPGPETDLRRTPSEQRECPRSNGPTRR